VQGLYRYEETHRRTGRRSIHKTELIRDPRTPVDRGAYSSVRLWQAPYRDIAGELSGPLVTREEIESLLPERKTIDDLLATIHASISNERTAENTINYEDYRAIYDESMDELEAMRQERSEEIKRMRLAKQDSLRAIVERVKSCLIGDWKEFCLDARWPDCTQATYAPTFKSGIVTYHMTRLMVAPTSASHKKITEVASRIDAAFNTVYESGFADFSFLSTDNIFESHLREYLQGQNTPSDLLLCDSRPQLGYAEVKKASTLEMTKCTVSQS